MAFNSGGVLSQAQASAANALVQNRLATGGTVRFVVPSASMRPLLQAGDTVSVRGVRAREARVGDLVVAPIAGSWRVHRLVARRESGSALVFLTKGDDLYGADDEWVPPEWIGVVQAIVEKDGARAIDVAWARAAGRLVACISSAQSSIARSWPRGARRIGLVLAGRSIAGLDLLVRKGCRASAARAVESKWA